MSASSTALPNISTDPLPLAWVERIFERLHGRFGNVFVAKWQSGQLTAAGLDSGVENAKRVWANELAGFGPDELRIGLERRYNYPPSLDEFQAACRPSLDAKTAWVEACEQMRIRLQGDGMDRWSRPQVFWAAAKLGWHDLQSLPWDQVRHRWERALTHAGCDPVPVYRPALPAPGATTTTRDEARVRLATIRSLMSQRAA